MAGAGNRDAYRPPWRRQQLQQSSYRHLMIADTSEDAFVDPNVTECRGRGIIDMAERRVTYNLSARKSYDWSDPEEWVRCRCIAFLIVQKSYPANRIRTEVAVPRRTPNDFADIVVYEDDRCRSPYLVVENKSAGQSESDRRQWIEQVFGNTNSLRAKFALYDEFMAMDGMEPSILFDVHNYPPTERKENVRGGLHEIPEQYGEAPEFAFIAGSDTDISAVRPTILESKIRRAHSLIWAGGKRDPLAAFDEWSKLLFAKVTDERHTPSGEPRQFQVAAKETTAAVANRVHALFREACRRDPTIFLPTVRLNLNDRKIADVVKVLQDVSLMRTDIDSVGTAFEGFFSSVFRGELGQYFTMRQLARFVVAMLDIKHNDYVIDPTAGSGGFLLEALLQVWHSIDQRFLGQPPAEIARLKYDFAQAQVYGIEIHEILSRILKINLMLHHDGHTNIEGNRSCLDSTFVLPRLMPPRAKFTCVIGNPPFGDDVEEGDDDHLGDNSLEHFTVAAGRKKVESEHVIIERSIELLEPGGRLGLVIPDGTLNNQAANCPTVRRLLMTTGQVLAVVSLPDYAFRKAGAQNKTSLLFFRKFTVDEARIFGRRYKRALDQNHETDQDEAIGAALAAQDYHIFLAEANFVGYTPTGATSADNDLYRSAGAGTAENQDGTILGEYRRFRARERQYQGRTMPDCMGVRASELWASHPSRRLDPKYFLFKRQETAFAPEGWLRLQLTDVMRRRNAQVFPELAPDARVVVMTISQTGEIRPREAGKGRNPPEWLGMYFVDSPSRWYAARHNDVVYSSIDLWKGCVAVVPGAFDGALVSNEFPIYEVIDSRLDPEFLSLLLRSRYYQRAFRAITTGHSNRRRTQAGDFEALEVCFPPNIHEQRALIQQLVDARARQRQAAVDLDSAMLTFSAMIDGRGDEQLPGIDEEPSEYASDDC